MWISNAPFADIAVVWAKNEEGRIKGLIVEKGMKGFSTPETHNKWSLRASATGELIFDNVKIPKVNLLPNKDGLSAPLGCLDSARYGIAWGAIGAAMDCYDTALLTEELGRFPTWFAEALLGQTLDDGERTLLQACFDRLIASALEQPRGLVHRDFHSRNLMPQADGSLGVIDFQDAVIGPVTYDLVSLLRDCYIQWPPEQVEGFRQPERPDGPNPIFNADRPEPADDDQHQRDQHRHQSTPSE